MLKYIRHVITFAGSRKTGILLAAIPLFLKSMMSQMMIFYSYLMITRLLDKEYEPKDSWIFAGAICFTLLLQALCQNLSDRLQSSSGFIVMAEKRKELGEHLRRMPMGYFSEGNIGNISTVLATDMTYLEEHGIAIVSAIMNDISNIIVTLVFLMIIDAKIGLIYLVAASLVLILSKGMTRTSFREADVRQNQNQALASAVIEFVSGVGVVKSFPAAGFAVDNVKDAFHKSAEDNLHFEKKYTPWNILLGSICALGTAGILAVGLYELRTGTMERGFFLGLALFEMNLFASVKALYGQSANLSLAESSLNRIDALFMETELPDNGTEHIPDQAVPEIAFKNVSFAYGERQVLHNISFTANKGEMVALAGPSGGGKSTAVNLIARLWDVKSGEVLIRGKDIRNVPLSELMDEISMVFQRVYLFKDTVYNNIAMGKPDASKEDVINAAKKARAHDFIMQLPDGYDTVLGEGGASLSGGERQRISIARCILKDAPIILLDEATASVDVDNEYYIQEAISELCRNKTVIAIAHRLYTVSNADQILVIKDGQIAERGSYPELIGAGGIFAEMAAS